MRLHRLTVEAFGPFAERATVDFDELNDAGLFLLTGATGAGKSSLLDAVCFALYGTVPGARGVKALKSQHAPATTQPEVELDFSVRGRRFVVRRTPEWSRPKKRGDGLLPVRASASITETTEGEHFISSRAAEVGHLVTDLMGMHASQFMQVALLPQGEFQTFLRASSQERHDVLEHLFRTDRFSRIEDWVHEHSRLLRDRAGDGESTVRRLLDTVADRAGVELPETLVGDALSRSTADGSAGGWVDDRVTEARGAVTVSTEAEASAHADLDHARRRHDLAVRRTEAAARVASAQQVLAALDETEAEAAAARAALRDDRSAAGIRPVLRLLDEAARAVEQAASAHARDVTALGPEHAEADVDGLRDRAATLRALVPREAAAARARAAAQTARTRLAEVRRTLAAAVDRASALPAEIATAAQRIDELTALAGRQEALGLSLVAARGRRDAVRALAGLDPVLSALEAEQRACRERWLDAREHLQGLTERRLSGMAAELAAGLAPGEPCPVCGSEQHPAPAATAEDAVTESDQDAARAAVEAAQAALEEARQREQDARLRREALVAAAGDAEAATIEVEVADLESALGAARAAATAVVAAVAERDRLSAELDEIAQRQATAQADAAGLEESLAAHEASATEAEQELTEATGRTDRPSLGELARELDLVADLADAARRSGELAAVARTRFDELCERATGLADDAGLTDLEAARAALLADDHRDRLEALLAARAEQAAAARAVLDEHEESSATEDAGLFDDPVADLEQSLEHLRAGEARAAAAARERVLAVERLDALTRTRDALRDAVTAWAPARDASLRAESMARLVRGTGPDNLLQMRLSAYVLATRLDQVVEAANERLGHMRDQRYLLQRTGRALRRNAQAGLGLEVVDQWTGDTRDPTTLSGGETFVVSLSLALGLSDVVTQEAGGAEIETLFVDEGFGTLDADTLDDVMDRLDGLRSGGRTVGVVSHVTELRSRIPTQVHVEKGRTGSTIGTATLVG